MINFLGLRSILFNEGPWGAWSKDENKGVTKKKTTKSEKKTTKKTKSSTGSGGSNKNDDQDNKKKSESKEQAKDDSVKEEKDAGNTIVGPWGSVAQDNSQQANKEQNQENKYENLIKDLVSNNSFGQNNKSERRSFSGGGGSFGGGNFGGGLFNKFDKSPKKIIGLAVLAATSLWLATGFYKVNSDENALVLYFGKYHAIATPGLNYRIPYPIGKVVKQSVTTVNSEEFGYRARSAPVRRIGRRVQQQSNTAHTENLMLTGDENIVDIEFQVQWQIKDIERFTFNISQPRLTIRKSAESAMREIIAVTPISEALSDGKSKVEQTARKLMQETLDSYGAGVRIVLLQLRRVDPPPQVIDSFRDVQTAKADKEREINEAQAYANDIIPRARGNAAELQEKALAYKDKVTADAQGEASRFLSLYKQYKRAKEVTRRRMYLETMQQVYGNVDKVIIDSKVSKGSLMPYFPLGDLNKAKK